MRDQMEDDFDPDLTTGEGADRSAMVSCPYCGASVELMLDPGGGSDQRYVEDCEICCNPWRVHVRYDDLGSVDVSVLRESD